MEFDRNGRNGRGKRERVQISMDGRHMRKKLIFFIEKPIVISDSRRANQSLSNDYM